MRDTDCLSFSVSFDIYYSYSYSIFDLGRWEFVQKSSGFLEHRLAFFFSLIPYIVTRHETFLPRGKLDRGEQWVPAVLVDANSAIQCVKGRDINVDDSYMELFCFFGDLTKLSEMGPRSAVGI